MTYWRPLPQIGPLRPKEALTLAGGWSWFTHVAAMERGGRTEIVPADETPGEVLDTLSVARAPIAGLPMDVPRIMGILNVTPDSFSDGGLYASPEAAQFQAERMVSAGAEILDVGGESTRPGAETVPSETEIARIAPVIASIRAVWNGVISIDTRKAGVARAALDAGAGLLNDVSGLTYDPGMARLAADSGSPLCLMHARGEPRDMQTDPRYEDVLFDVYDALSDRLASAERAGIERARLIVDPGIGFGKTLVHNLRLLSHISLFHGLGVPILLGVSRKRFIGTIGGGDTGPDRMPGSLAVGLAAMTQGVQILRVHDTVETAQARALWRAATTGEAT